MPDIGLGGCGAGAIIMISLLCPGTLTERARTAVRLRWLRAPVALLSSGVPVGVAAVR
jgi:hypothetical protein